MTGDAPGDPSECFGCGQVFARDQLEVVGDTVFCRACHARMLRRIDERRARGESSGPVRAPGPSTTGAGGPTRTPSATGGDARSPLRGASSPSPLARPAAADAPCFVCGGPLDGATLFELRGFAICGNCARGLIGDEPPPGAPAASVYEDDDDDLLDDDELDDAPRLVAPEGSGQTAGPLGSMTRGGSSRVVATPGTGTEWCTGCDRPMPGPGSYQLIAGRPYCPACVAARSRKTGPMRVSSGPPPVDEDPPSRPDACDACMRTIDPAQVPETEGFRLCAACLHSDPELALAIARSRHQRRLAREGRRLLDGDDD